MRPVTDPAAPEYDLAPLVKGVDVEALAERLTEAMIEQVYSDVADPAALRAPLLDATVEKLGCLTALIAGTTTLERMRPASSLAFAARVGRLGVAEATFERSYRVGQAALWEWWMTVVERHCDRTGDSVPEVLRPSIPLLFGFVDRMLFLSLAAYHQAVAERHQSREHRRARVVEQLLDGSLEEPGADAERFIGYALRQLHLAAVLDRGDRAADHRLAEELRAAAGASAVLTLDRTTGTSAVWLGLERPPAGAAMTAVEAAVRRSGRRVAFGDPQPGLAGFRASHADAMAARAVQELSGAAAAPATWAREVRVEMLALRCPEAARALVEAELGPVLHGGLLTDRVGETLDAWLVTGSNVGAASLLGVHEQTVRNRLRRVEEALGHGLISRRTELHVALRLSRLDLTAAGRPGG